MESFKEIKDAPETKEMEIYERTFLDNLLSQPPAILDKIFSFLSDSDYYNIIEAVRPCGFSPDFLKRWRRSFTISREVMEYNPEVGMKFYNGLYYPKELVEEGMSYKQFLETDFSLIVHTFRLDTPATDKILNQLLNEFNGRVTFNVVYFPNEHSKSDKDYTIAKSGVIAKFLEKTQAKEFTSYQSIDSDLIKYPYIQQLNYLRLDSTSFKFFDKAAFFAIKCPYFILSMMEKFPLKTLRTILLEWTENKRRIGTWFIESTEKVPKDEVLQELFGDWKKIDKNNWRREGSDISKPFVVKIGDESYKIICNDGKPRCLNFVQSLNRITFSCF